jgi:glycosyltransferase involved in cell wall biosynthesis
MSKIAVLIPHYNNYQGLKKSVKSIQESIPVDLIIIDDGSKKDTIDEEDLKTIYQFGKIIIHKLELNKGIEYALNCGLELIQKLKYKYIGRLDCGDTCLKERFTKQIKYLDSNNEVSLLGTWANIIDSNGKNLFVLKHPVHYKEIKKKMYFNSMFIHPSVVFKSSVIKAVGFYPTNYKAAEDYAYFFKIVKHFKAENLPEPLINYIIDDNSISSTKRKLQVKSRIRVICDNFYIGYYPIYGLLRNVVLLFMSRNLTTGIKKLIGRNA